MQSFPLRNLRKMDDADGNLGLEFQVQGRDDHYSVKAIDSDTYRVTLLVKRRHTEISCGSSLAEQCFWQPLFGMFFPLSQRGWTDAFSEHWDMAFGRKGAETLDFFRQFSLALRMTKIAWGVIDNDDIQPYPKKAGGRRPPLRLENSDGQQFRSMPMPVALLRRCAGLKTLDFQNGDTMRIGKHRHLPMAAACFDVSLLDYVPSAHQSMLAQRSLLEHPVAAEDGMMPWLEQVLLGDGLIPNDLSA